MAKKEALKLWNELGLVYLPTQLNSFERFHVGKYTNV